MIPSDFITEWREYAPWNSDAQVEQDLIISRCIIEVFSEVAIQGLLAFRGGTALYKLFAQSPVRYSEDIDLVRTTTGPIAHIIRDMQSKLDGLFVSKETESKDSSFKLKYRYNAEDAASTIMRIKIEINTREHVPIFGYRNQILTVKSRWFKGATAIQTYTLEELLGTKLRALYQRRKGRDLFDIWYFARHTPIDLGKVVAAFKYYITGSGLTISRREFEINMRDKASNAAFRTDVDNYLRTGTEWSFDAAMDYLLTTILPLL